MKGKWFAFGCLSSVIIVIVIMVSAIISLTSMSKLAKVDQPAKLQDNSTLYIKLSGQIIEYNELKSDFFMNPFMPDVLAAQDIVEKIKMATNDPRVDDILLEPYWIQAGYATIHEIGLALNDFKASGKKVYAYLEMCGNKDYLLATYADEIYMNPSASAGILLTGVGSSMLFYKDLFDKLGIEMTVLHAGKYKGAGETYYRTSLSAPVKKNLSVLFDDVYGNMLGTITANREIDIDEITYIYEKRDQVFINQKSAINYKLIDELIFKEDLIKKLVVNKKQLFSLSKYKVKKLTSNDLDNIAVLYLQGQIAQKTSNYQQNVLSSAKLAKAVDNIIKDNSIKGVVLRIDSPGGSALESEIMHNKLLKLRNHVPVVVSMANVAASGGYYISTPADYVYADPFTITGSIGVVAMFPNIAGLREKIGISTDTIENGKFSNILNLYNKPDPTMLTSFKKGIDQTYIEFKTRVSNGRNLSMDEVEKLAQGQVWSSASALDIGLIDEVGSIRDAKLKAAELANMNNFNEKYFPIKKNMFEEMLLEKLQTTASTDLSDLIMDNLDIQNSIQRIELIKNDPVQMILPLINLTD